MPVQHAWRIALLVTAWVLAAPAQAETALDPAWKLTWHDEFDAPAGTGVDAAKWQIETGGGGWGNNELQYYTEGTANLAQDGSGNLVFTAKKEQNGLRCINGDCEYTSARIKTLGKFIQQYGRFEARMQIPGGAGIWPAWWMMGSNLSTEGWPKAGEIDIMENIGREPTLIHGTYHGPGYAGAEGPSTAYHFPNSPAVSAGFHVYAVEWTPNEIRWYADGTLFKTAKPSDLNGRRWVFNNAPFYMILNLAVGGSWPGSPDEKTVFPAQMKVDYVRVYQRADLAEAAEKVATALAAQKALDDAEILKQAAEAEQWRKDQAAAEQKAKRKQKASRTQKTP